MIERLKTVHVICSDICPKSLKVEERESVRKFAVTCTMHTVQSRYVLVEIGLYYAFAANW